MRLCRGESASFSYEIHCHGGHFVACSFLLCTRGPVLPQFSIFWCFVFWEASSSSLSLLTSQYKRVPQITMKFSKLALAALSIAAGIRTVRSCLLFPTSPKLKYLSPHIKFSIWNLWTVKCCHLRSISCSTILHFTWEWIGTFSIQMLLLFWRSYSSKFDFILPSCLVCWWSKSRI